MNATIKFDGGTRPTNPGPSAIGYIVSTDDSTERGSHHIGEATNNQAEYHALIQALQTARQMGCTDVVVRGDSQLIVKQVQGDWKVNDSELHTLWKRATELAEEFESFDIQHVPREDNEEVNRLVDQAFSV